MEEARRAAAEYKARQRMLGNIQFIGQLYIKKMLTERIMHECIVKLLGEVRPTLFVPSTFSWNLAEPGGPFLEPDQHVAAAPPAAL